MKPLKTRWRFLFIIILINCLLHPCLYPDDNAEADFNKEDISRIETFKAGTGKIRTIAVSPDGRYTAISDSSQVRIWDGNEYISRFNAKQINSLLFSPDGSLLVGGGYRYIYVWDVSRGRRIRHFDAHENLITALAFSPDGRILASGSKGNDPVVKLWDINSQRLPKVLRWDYPYSEQVLALAFSADGKLLASASLDQKSPVRIWNIKTLNDKPVSFRNGTVRKLIFSPDNEFLMAGLDNGTILKISYHQSGSDRFSILKGHSDSISGIGFTLNAEYLISGSMDGRLIYWDTGNWKRVKTITLPDTDYPLMISTDIGAMAVIEKREAILYSLPDFFGPGIEVSKTRDIHITASITHGLIEGIVNDESNIKKVLINGIEAKLTMPSQEERLKKGIKGRGMIFSGMPNIQANEDMVEITAFDIHNNKTVDFVRIETKTSVPPTPAKVSVQPQEITDFGRNYALIIGNNNYEHLSYLKTAQNDAKGIEKVLREDYGYETTLIIDGTRSDILGTLNRYRKRLTRNDNLLIYYAGHGHLDTETDKAYWLPVEAEEDDTTNWIMVDDITTNIKRLSSNHILIVADSCFSGAMARQVDIDLRSAEKREDYLKRLFNKRSRTLISSGGNEPVIDDEGNGHSVFANVFIRALKEMKEPAFTADEFFSRQNIKESVAGRSDQTPEYNPIRNSGHDSGDFIFSRAK